MGWLIALGVVVLIAILPVGVRCRYSGEGVRLAVCVGLVRILILPRKKTEKKQKEDPPTQKKKSATAPKQTASKEEQETGGSWTDFLPLVQVVLNFLGAFARKIRIDRLELKLILAGDDPCDLATNYGRAWAAVGNLLPRLERVFVIRRRNIDVECDFLSDTTKVIAGAKITISLGRLLALGVWFGWRALRQYWKIKQNRKGGAAK